MRNTTTRILNILLNNPSAIVIKFKRATTNPPDLTALIISIYANFNLLQDCLSLFNSLSSPPPPNAWKSIIKCCAANGDFVGSIVHFKKMWASGPGPDRIMFPSLLKTCAHLWDLRLGEAEHGCAVRLGMDAKLFMANALMSMYSKSACSHAGKVFDDCSQSQDFKRSTNVDDKASVRKVFESMPAKDVLSWNTVIGGHVQNGTYGEALLAVKGMGEVGLKPDSYTVKI